MFKGLNTFNQKKLLEEKINKNENYLNGKYDLILNDLRVTVEFEGLFALKDEYLLVSERTNKRFNLFKTLN